MTVVRMAEARRKRAERGHGMSFRGRGSSTLPELEWRRQATEATLARYRNKPFDWATGVTCVHMARFQLRNMGHRPPSLPRFRGALGAKKAMKERGWPSVSAMLDSMLPRIPPAAMLLGDLAVVEGDAGMDSIMVCAGPQRLFGWREDAEGLVVLSVQMSEVSGAWRL